MISEHLNEAGAGGDMSVRMQSHIEKGGSLQIVGSDVFYLQSKKGKIWQNFLQETLKKECNVDYIFTVVNEEDKKYLKTLKAAIQPANKAANLNFYILDEQNQTLKETYKTYHPTLLATKTPKKRRLWLEKNHIPNSNYAFDVWFLAPNYTDFEQLYMKTNQEIITLKQHCNQL